MWAFLPITLAQPRTKIARYAAVMRILVSFADEDVNVVESVHQTAWSKKKAGLPSCGLLERERKFKVARLRFAPAWQPRKLSGLEARGFEPLTSSLQSWRSTN